MSASGPGCVFVLSGRNSAGWAKAMLGEIHAALRHLGIDALLVDVHSDAEMQAAGRYAAGREVAVIDANHKLDSRAPVVRFSVMVDHPCIRYADVKERHQPASLLGWVDATHLDAAAELGLAYPSIFLPHAGPDPVPAPKPMAEREIDLFFSAHLAEPITREMWAAKNPQCPPVVVAVLFDAIERMVAGAEASLPAMKASAEAHGVALRDMLGLDSFCDLVAEAEQIAEAGRRVEILAALPDIGIAIASPILPARLAGRANIRHLGAIADFAEVRRWMANSRIVLNTTGKFPTGAHERIWFGMAEGAVVLTDRSSFLRRDFTEGEDILFLPSGRPGVGDLACLRPLLRETTRLQRLAERARAIYEAGHSWKRRILPLWTALCQATGP